MLNILYDTSIDPFPVATYPYQGHGALEPIH